MALPHWPKEGWTWMFSRESKHNVLSSKTPDLPSDKRVCTSWHLSSPLWWKQTLISPSADPVIKNSSLGSRAIHLTATDDSWAVNLWRKVLCLKSHMHTSPLRPADINNWCWLAYNKLVPPFSWHAKAVDKYKTPLLQTAAIKFAKKVTYNELLPCAEASVCPTRPHYGILSYGQLWPRRWKIPRKRNPTFLCCGIGLTTREKLINFCECIPHSRQIYIIRTMRLGPSSDAQRPQSNKAVTIRHAEFIALVVETQSRHFSVGSCTSRLGHDSDVTPFPNRHRSISLSRNVCIDESNFVSATHNLTSSMYVTYKEASTDGRTFAGRHRLCVFSTSKGKKNKD